MDNKLTEISTRRLQPRVIRDEQRSVLETVVFWDRSQCFSLTKFISLCVPVILRVSYGPIYQAFEKYRQENEESRKNTGG